MADPNFVVDHACEIMPEADKTGALLKKLICLELRPRTDPMWGGNPPNTIEVFKIAYFNR